jgi:hypothetical protein
VNVTQTSNSGGQSSSDNGSGGNSGQGSRKPRPRNRNRKRKPGPKTQGASAQGGRNEGQPKKKTGSNNNNRRKRSQRTGPKLTGFEKVERCYLNLLEKHLEARRKYYELFHRADPRQLEKLERNFSRTADDMRKYEDEIKPEFKDEFQQKYNGLKRDLTYSSNHGIAPDEDPVPFEGDFDDPHLLPSQVEHEFSEDEEESSGSIEDYQRYKGLD